MLNISKPKDIALIRENYSTHPLFITLRDACTGCCDLTRTYDLRPEQLFVDVIHLLDEWKHHDGNVDWSNLYRLLKQDYHLIDKNISDNDLSIIASTIVTTLGNILTAYFSYYKNLAFWTIAQSLLLQPTDQYISIPQQSKDEIAKGIIRHNHELITWLDNYLHSATYLSASINNLFNNIGNSDVNARHIVFTTTATTQQREEFISTLLRLAKAKKGTKGTAEKVKKLLIKYHSDGIIKLIAPIDGIYDDLVNIYGYKQSRSGFYDSPYLTSILDIKNPTPTN